MYKHLIHILMLLTISISTTTVLSSKSKSPENAFTRSFPEYSLYEVDAIKTKKGYIIAGEDGFSPVNNILVLSLDKNGEKLWEKLYNLDSTNDTYDGTGAGAWSIDQTKNGYVIAGYKNTRNRARDALILKLDNNGNILWKKTYGGRNDDYATSVKSIKDGFIVAGYTKGKGPKFISYWLAKLNSDGNIVWQKYFGSKSVNNARKVIADKNSFTIAGSSSDWTGNSEIYIVNTDLDGNLKWETKIPNQKLQDLRSFDNGLIVLSGRSGYPYLTKISKSGTIEWKKLTSYRCIDINRNKIIGTYTSQSEKSQTQCIDILDKKGSIIDKKQIVISEKISIEKFIAIPDGYLTAGIRESKNYSMYFSKSDFDLKTVKRDRPFKVLPNSKRELLYAIKSKDTETLERLINSGADINKEIPEKGLTPLYLAISNGNEEAIKLLLKHGASIESEVNNNLLLHNAVSGGSLWFIKEIHDKYPDVYKEQINKMNSNRYTPLLVAIMNNQMKVAEYLIETGAKVNPDSKYMSPLLTALSYENSDMALLLIKNGADVHRTDPFSRKTALHYAVKNNNIQLLKELLLQGANPNVRDKNGITPLHLAAGQSYEICEILLKNKAEVNAEITSGMFKSQTPLQIAILVYKNDIVNLLIKYGADINTQIEERFLWSRSNSQRKCSLLEIAFIAGDDIIANMLIESGADVNEIFVTNRYKGLTPLHTAILNKKYSLIMNLLYHGAKIDTPADTEYYGKITPLDLSFKKDLKELFDYTGKGKNVLNKKLAAAIKKKNLGKIKQYLKSGADVNYRIKDKSSERRSFTMLDIAVKAGDLEVVKLITEELLKTKEKPSYPKRSFNTVIENKDNKIFKYLYNKFKPTFSKYSEPSMAEAIYNKNIEVLKFLIDQNHNLRNFNFNTYTVINYAFNMQSPQMAHILRNASNLSQINKDLYNAIYTNNLNLVKKLLKTGAQINVSDFGSISPLCWAAFLGHNAILKHLITNGATVQPEKLQGDRTAIYWACAMGNIESVKTLIKNGADVEAYDPWSYECIHIAAEHGHADIVELLLDSGANINSQSIRHGHGQKAMHIAAEYGQINVIKLLLKRGQSINVHSVNYENWETPLMTAVRNNQLETALFLIENNADIFATSKNKKTSLHYAVYSDNKKIIKLLLDHKSDINARDDFNQTPLMVAVKNGKLNTANYLFSKSANTSISDKAKRNILHFAAEKGYIEIAKAILKKNKNININQKNEEDLTPLMLSIINENYEIAKLFIKKGADINIKLPEKKYDSKTILEVVKDFSTWKLLRNKGANFSWELE